MNPHTCTHSMRGAIRVAVAAWLLALTTLGCGPKPGDVPYAPPKTDPTKGDPSKTPIPTDPTQKNSLRGNSTKADPLSTLREPIDRRDTGTYFI